MDKILPPNLSNIGHIDALEQTIRNMFDSIDTEAAMMYMVDTVAVSALPFLAEQFDVLGYRGWKLAVTEADKRTLIKQAIAIKKRMGTVWAIKQALLAVGYGSAVLTEGVNLGDPDTDWANFQIDVSLGATAGLDADTPQELTRLILEYKPARSYLVAISFNVNGIIESVDEPLEELNYEYHTDLADTLFTGGLKYDGSKKYDGSAKYRPGVESFECNII